MKYSSQRSEVINISRQMNDCGINQGTSGNVSTRVDDGFLVTGSGIAYDAMEPQHVVEVTLEGGYFGEFLPSSEWRMHLDIYRTRPEAGAVVHVHSPYATALSCLGEDIPAFHYMIAVAGGDTIRCADYATFGTEALSVNMLVALADRTACLLANHGMICFAPDLKTALALAVEVETLCHQFVIARQAGEPVILDAAEMEIILAKFKTYGKQADELEDAGEQAVLAPKHLG
ncbi:MAG: class II aldolase/adducin family protein [Rhizobiaceae bacterium]